MRLFFTYLCLISGLVGFSNPLLAMAAGDSTAQMAMDYRVQTGDYSTSPATLGVVFSSFLAIKDHSNKGIEQLVNDEEFLRSMNEFTTSLNKLLSERVSVESKKATIQTLLNIFSANVTFPEGVDGSTFLKMFQTNMEVIAMKLDGGVVPANDKIEGQNLFSLKEIKVKKNDVLKAVGSGGLYGFWLVTSTLGLIWLNPSLQQNVYLPAFSLMVASAPFSISNQIWMQFFDQIHQKTTIKQSRYEYIKGRLSGLKSKLKFPKFRNEKSMCLSFYKN